MDWKSILGSVAPTIATALGGPMAGAAVKFLGSQFLDDENAGEDQVAEFVRNSSPETLLKVKQADQVFAVQMEKLGVDVFKIEAQDKQNARSEHKQSIMPSVMSIMLTVTVIGLIYMLFYVEPPEGAKDALMVVLGMVLKEWANSMHFWYGTTRSSAEKTSMIKK
ncbi:TMhelix containing protein [Vibrio phage 1.275.O._10N.286.54.E11]|nr:TMhelix containing protein [Vibrio phage 1.275.O._10N.286.54.E11]